MSETTTPTPRPSAAARAAEAALEAREEQIRGELRSIGYGAGEINAIVKEANDAAKEQPTRTDARDDVYRAAIERKHRGE